MQWLCASPSVGCVDVCACLCVQQTVKNRRRKVKEKIENNVRCCVKRADGSSRARASSSSKIDVQKKRPSSRGKEEFSPFVRAYFRSVCVRKCAESGRKKCPQSENPRRGVPLDCSVPLRSDPRDRGFVFESGRRNTDLSAAQTSGRRRKEFLWDTPLATLLHCSLP